MADRTGETSPEQIQLENMMGDVELDQETEHEKARLLNKDNPSAEDEEAARVASEDLISADDVKKSKSVEFVPSTSVSAKPEDEDDRMHNESEITDMDLPEYLMSYIVSPEPVIEKDVAPGGEPCGGGANLEPTCCGRTDLTAFKEHLETIKPGDTKALRDELHRLTRQNDEDRLHHLCHYLKDLGIRLDEDSMLGDSFQESALHTAIVLGSTASAKVLIEMGGPDLVMKPYTNQEYNGVTALHLAVIQDNLDVVHAILMTVNDEQKQTLLHAKGDGKDFDYKYDFVWIPLHMAAAQGSMGTFDALLHYGADLWKPDEETGNFVLHTLARVAVSQSDLCCKTLKLILESQEVRRWWSEKKELTDALKKDKPSNLVVPKNLKEALLKLENRDGLTPFTYAVCMGATQYANTIYEIKNLYTFPQWSLGSTSYSLFEMSEVDSAISSQAPKYMYKKDEHQQEAMSKPKVDGFMDSANALEIYTFGLGDGSLDFGQLEPIKWAMINKWNIYKWWFLAWLICHFVIMICFTICLSNRPLPGASRETNDDVVNSSDELGSTSSPTTKLTSDNKYVTVLVLECILLTSGLVYFVLEIVDIVQLIRRKYWKGRSCQGTRQRKIPLLMTLQFDVYRLLLFAFSVSILVAFLLRLVDSEWQDVAYASAGLTGWGFMSFFTRAFKNIGIFTVMLRRMFTRDLAYFSVVFVIFLMSFGTAWYSIFQQSIHGHPEQVESITRTLFSLFRLLVGLEEFYVSNESHVPVLSKILFILFVLFSNILLLNMLIAAMSNTYNQFEEMKEPMWMKTRTKAILLIERRLPTCLRPKHNLNRFGSKQFWFLGEEQMQKWNPHNASCF